MNALLLWAASAWARAGGGHGYSGGGRSHGGGGSFGGGGGSFRVRGTSDHDGDNLIVWLVLEHPVVGIPLVLVLVGFVVYTKVLERQQRRIVIHGAPEPPPAARPSTQSLRAADPNFSEALFLDLARLVFVRAHEERGRGHSALLDAYVEPDVRERLEAITGERTRVGAAVGSVRDVIIGTARLVRAEVRHDMAHLTVQLQANVTEGERKRLVIERWTFSRAAGARSPGPAAMRVLACPQCASTNESLRDGRCPNCDVVRGDSRLQWRVSRVERLSARDVPRVELSLGGGVEVGAEVPTVRAPDLGAQLRALQARDPSFQWSRFEERVTYVFLRIQEAWGRMRQDDARPYETDFLYQQHRYWIDRYRAEGLRNQVQDTRVHAVTPSRITVDAYVETITVRVEASMLDWTEDASGTVVGGSRTERKHFSEYWTFVRSAGSAAGRGARASWAADGSGARPDTVHTTGHRSFGDPDRCPSCGAPLDNVSAAGICGYCEAHITSGDHDWVLSAIDQDEDYRG